MLMKSQWLFILLMGLGYLLVSSSTSYFCIWLGIELSNVGLLPYLSLSYEMEKYRVLKYFLLQLFTSLIMLLGMGLSCYLEIMGHSFLVLTVMMKSGLVPFHKWIFPIILSMGWAEIFVLGVLHKFPILVFMNSVLGHFMMADQMIIFCAMLSGLLGGLLAMNQLNIRKLMISSSLTHLGWISCLNVMSGKAAMMYFMVYCLLNLLIMILLQVSNIMSVIDMNKETFSIKWMITITFLSLGGLPPFTGFILKWYAILYLISCGLYEISALLIVSSLLTLFAYFRLMWNGCLNSDSSKNMNCWGTGLLNLKVMTVIIHLSGPFWVIVF